MMSSRWFVPLLVALLLGTALAVFPAAPAEAAGTVVTGSLRWDGLTRTYRVYVPSGYDADTPTPLVVGLHGGLGSGNQFATSNGFDAGAESRGVLAVYPDGVPNPANNVRTWNAGLCCSYALQQGIDDVGFINALVQRVEAVYNVDPARVYATGHSNGAMLSYKLACDLPGVFAAIAPVEGAIDDTHPCAPGHPINVLAIHGRLERHVPFDGGVGDQGLIPTDYPSVAEAIRRWRAINHCAGPADVTTQGDLETTDATGCTPQGDVRLRALADGNHEWPGGADRNFIPGAPSDALDATADVLDFFATHRLLPSFTPPAFPDVAEGARYEYGLAWAAHHALLVGFPDGTFRPRRAMRRSEAAVTFHRFMGMPSSAPGPDFADVPDDAPYRDALDWAAVGGVLTGFSDGTFRPTASLTRSRAVSAAWRVAGAPVVDDPSGFTDVAPGAPYRQALDWAAHHQLVTGSSHGRFRPKAPMTRAQLTMLLYRLAAAPAAWAPGTPLSPTRL